MDLPRLSTFDEVFKHLGGYPGLGELTGAKTTAISNWVTNKQFPARLYLQIITKLHDIGFDADPALWNMAGVERESAA